MPDSRADAVVQVVARMEGAACWLAALAARAALAGGAAGLALWWFTAGERVTDWWQGTAASLLVLGLGLAPAAWLVNVRSAMTELVELPDTLWGVARRRIGDRAERPDGGLLGAVRSVRGVVRDYGDVIGSWGTVAQLVVPSFWFLTLVALAAVPVLCILALVAVLLGSR